MSEMTTAIGSAASLLALENAAIGQVNPGPPAPPLPDLDPREHALRTFAKFISFLNFSLTGAVDSPPEPFRIPLNCINIYQPDDVKNEPPGPSIGILPGRGTHEPVGLGPPVAMDDTADVYGVGTLLYWQGDYSEQIGVEIVTAKHAERRAVLAGLKTALRIGDDAGALRLRCRSYFDRVAVFRLDESEMIDDANAALNRRRAHLYVLMEIQEVLHVPYKKVVPVITTQVFPPGFDKL